MQSRHRVPEIMDDQGLDRDLHDQALLGLRRINRFSCSVNPLWQPIAKAAKANGGETLRVLDLACGGGDVAIGMARRARTEGLAVEVQGADFSAQAVEIATENSQKAGLDVKFFMLDTLVDALPDAYDILTCTLFLHHLDKPEATLLLGKMAASARKMMLVDDLIRSNVGYALAWAGCRLLSRSRVVHHDGPASVAGAFRVDEALALAAAAGLEGVTIRKHWPERFLLSWSRP